MPQDDDLRGLDAVAALIADQLSDERARKASLEQRATGIVTSSAALIASLGAISALATRRGESTISTPAVVLVCAAVVLLLGSSALAARAWSPRSYANVADPTLDDFVSDKGWATATRSGNRDASVLRIEITKRAREVNDKKARWLTVALWVQIAAILFLGATAVALA
jgi:hypothetical protein